MNNTNLVFPDIIEILKAGHEKIKKIVFCSSCSNSGNCYIESVYKLVGLSNSYCGAGESNKIHDDSKFYEFIAQLENIDNYPNKNELLQFANQELRYQNRILRNMIYCKNCSNHKNCDAEDELVRMRATSMFCCVGNTKRKEEKT